ncbi:MAG: hypothetical protein AAF483_01795 [Planctomycetota bacterium]
MKARPGILLEFWLLAFFLKLLCNYAASRSILPLAIGFGLYYAFIAMIYTVHIWLGMLEPHSRRSIIAPILLLVFPSLSTIWLYHSMGIHAVGYIQLIFDYFGLTVAVSVLYLLSIFFQLRLYRGDDPAVSRILNTRLLMGLTVLVALATCLVQFFPNEELPEPYAGSTASSYLASLAVFSIVGALTDFTFCCFAAHPRLSTFLLACLGFVANIGLVLGYYFLDESLSANQMDLPMLIAMAIAPTLGKIPGILIIIACGYRFRFSDGQTQTDVSAPEPEPSVDPFAD